MGVARVSEWRWLGVRDKWQMSSVPSHTAFLFFFAEPQKMPRLPYSHIFSIGPSLLLSQQVRGVPLEGVCVHVFFCMRVFPVACMCWIWGMGLVHLGGKVEVCKFHVRSTEA